MHQRPKFEFKTLMLLMWSMLRVRTGEPLHCQIQMRWHRSKSCVRVREIIRTGID